jgi:hypothetical protein
MAKEGDAPVRKLRQAEITVLVAGLAVGNALVHADENFDLPTITVTSTSLAINTVTIYLVPLSTDIYSTTQAIASGTNSPDVSSSQTHAINCAKAYSGLGKAGTPAGNVGPRPGYVIDFFTQYGWGKTIFVQGTFANTSPGAGWTMIDGFTTPIGATAGTSMIFLSSVGPSAANLVNALAHEWSHEWGATDTNTDPNYNAYNIGAAAQAAYQNDKGAKCGGL